MLSFPQTAVPFDYRTLRITARKRENDFLHSPFFIVDQGSNHRASGEQRQHCYWLKF
jgi:hypothetical protein